jgi:hypothetical protein
VFRILVLLVVAFLLFATGAVCKCANRTIRLAGVIEGAAADGIEIAVQVTPDPNWEPQPEILIKDHKFVATVYFNIAKSEGLVRDNCSRVPETLEVVLLKDSREVDRAKLDVARDLTKDKVGDYKVRSPITLHSR